MFDVLIIGAGPSGLSVAIEAKKRGLNYIVIEKGGIVNAISNFPAEMTFFSTPELLEIGNVPFTSAQMRPTRAEGLEYYTRVASHYVLHCKFFETVITVTNSDGSFVVRTSRSVYQAKHVVIASGYYDNPNLLNIPGEELSKVSHYYNEPYQFYRQNVMIIGAKNSAAIAALELFRHGAHVTLIHRGPALSEKIKYWILPDLQNRIKEGGIIAHFNTEAVKINERSVLLKDAGGEFEIDNDFVFALTGYHPDYHFLRSCGIRLNDESNAPVLKENSFETSVKGIFVAGSIVAGKNNNSIFIENGRLHAATIVDSILKGA
jgi:thioredoxin reductase (NADPH)